ncbi:hypothetical protein HpBGD68_15090 [Helicobacter pylori]
MGISLDEASDLMHKHKIEKLPIVDKDNVLKGLITIKDLSPYTHLTLPTIYSV